MKRPLPRSRGIQLECLEARTLLSTAPVPHPPAQVAAVSAAAPKVVTIGGQVAGTAGPFANPRLPAYNTALSAKGTAAGLAGQVLLAGYQYSALNLNALKATVTNGKAVFTFTAARNTTLSVSFSGSGPINTRNYTSALTLTGTITGGTGVFAGVTGTFSCTATVNGLTHAFVLNYTFKITPAH